VIAIDNVLISDELVQNQFVCDLLKCKGGCCEEGDAGAPLDETELDIINKLYEKVKPYLTPAAVNEIEKNGKYVYHKEFGWVTPTLDSDREICVYGVRDGKGIIKCAFEQAYSDGVTNWKKPISCHLYPIISKKGKNGNYNRLNYEPRQKLCNPACALGKKLETPVYEFLKEPLIRLFGRSFYDALNKAAKKYYKDKEKAANNGD